MKLGEILSQEESARPLVGHDVEFWIKKGNTQRFRVKAKMYPLGEAERQQAQRDAVKYLRTLHDYKPTERDGMTYLPPIPNHEINAEERYKVLAAQLHDVDDPGAKFILNQDYGTFRSGMIAEQILFLEREYESYIRSEYPELITKAQQEELASEAHSK